jgi:hypothetical protein
MLGDDELDLVGDVVERVQNLEVALAGYAEHPIDAVQSQ